MRDVCATCARLKCDLCATCVRLVCDLCETCLRSAVGVCMSRRLAMPTAAASSRSLATASSGKSSSQSLERGASRSAFIHEVNVAGSTLYSWLKLPKMKSPSGMPSAARLSAPAGHARRVPTSEALGGAAPKREKACAKR